MRNGETEVKSVSGIAVASETSQVAAEQAVDQAHGPSVVGEMVTEKSAGLAEQLNKGQNYASIPFPREPAVRIQPRDPWQGIEEEWKDLVENWSTHPLNPRNSSDSKD